jgi:aspartate racemase
MKTIGLIGGTTWFSTLDYYKFINELTNQKLGALNSAKIILYSVNFQQFQPPSDPSEWTQITESFTDIALTLQTAGADCIAFCANTPHLIADKIEKAIQIPLIHIAEATAMEISHQNLKKVGVLGTRITMEQDFFKKQLSENQIEAIVPGESDRDFINSSIFNELGKGILNRQTKERFLSIIEDLINKGAEGLVFACTEIPLLIKPHELAVLSFDTTAIHCRAIVQFATS